MAQLVDLDGLNKVYKVSKQRLDLINGVEKNHNTNEIVIGKETSPKGPNTASVGDSKVTDTFIGEGNSNLHAKEIHMNESAFITYDDSLKAITFNFK